MTDEAEDLKRQLAELQQQNTRLKTINNALMLRVEAGPDNAEGAFDNFKHSVFLAEQVRERTEALNEAMHSLRNTNMELVLANDAATHAHELLKQAIESISDAFVLYDADRRLVMSNSRFDQFWETSGIRIEVGMEQQQIHKLAQRHRLIDRYYGDSVSVAYRALPGDGKIFHMRKGMWVHVSERSTRDGGLVVLYKDISALIENERALREEALAQKSRVLQNTLDNLSQGVVLVNSNGRLETWNRRFAELTGLSQSLLESGLTFDQIMAHSEVRDLSPAGISSDGLEIEQVLPSGRVLEIRTHPITTGEFVNTYTDITERSQAVKALAESEQRVRVITDTVPALIGYVDKDMKMTFSNRAYERWYGYDREVILGRRLDQFIAPAQFQRLKPYIDRALSGRSVSFEITDPAANGEARHVVKNYVPEFDEHGEVQGMYVLIRDITEIRRTSEALTQAYQHLEQRVEDRTSELTELNGQLRLEIEERREIENRLREAKLEAEKANHSKTKFLAAASHDLLQPMNAARLFCASLMEHSLDNKTRQLVHSLSYSLEDVETLLAALVDISKLDAGVVKPDMTAFQASDLLANLANEYRSLAAEAGLQFEYINTSAVITSDSQMLARILRNFLTNAVRYTRHGKITLGCRRRPQGLEIQVWDSGVGIAEDKLEEIFLEFNRGNQRDSARDKGLGLGLAIVDKMSGILNAPVSVKSRLGHGSCFSVLVPYGRRQQLSRGVSPGHFASGNQQFLGRRALVIDNEEAICHAMEVLLGSWGFDVLAVQSIEELLLCRDELGAGIDLVLADYHLDNGETGMQAVGLLREELAIQAPVLMITANYTNGLKQEVREQGYRLMNKPVRPAKLKAMIHHMLQSALVD